MKLPKHFAMQLYNRQISKQPGINVFDTFMFQSLFNNNVKTPASIMSIGKLLLMKCHRVKSQLTSVLTITQVNLPCIQYPCIP